MAAKQEALERLLEKLNPQQREAVCHGEGPLLIVAGAGTGKTSTLAHRVAYHIACGVDPRRILLLTFTRRAAAEMLKRVDSLLGRGPNGRRRTVSRRVWGGTFHAVATRLLRKYGRAIGLSPNFTVLDRGDAEDLMNLLRRELGLAETGSRFPQKGTCVSIYSRMVNAQDSVGRTVRRHFPWCVEFVDDLKRLFRAYTERKEQLQALDYDDLLLFWAQILAEPTVGEKIRGLFDRVLVDEYQDTNVLQAQILQRLCPDGRGLTVVGDDAQSIYSFRGATVRNILDFPKQFPGTTVVKLEENYRSTQPILDATNQVIGLAKKRYRKDLWSRRKEGERPHLVQCFDEGEQAEFVVERILERREEGVPLREQAVLFRASHHSMALELELNARNIPFHKYGGLKFVEAAHVKDLLAFLRLAENPLDVVSATRVLLLLPGIGHKWCERVVKALRDADGDFRSLSDFKTPKATTKYWKEFVELMVTLAQSRGRSSDVVADVHAVRQFYTPLLEMKYDDPFSRRQDLEQLEKMAARYKTRLEFLTELTLDPPSSTQDLPDDPWKDEDYLVLSTIHSAKGLEWDSVYIIHASDGNIPSDLATEDEEQLEEERRLLYVAMTRAKNRLYVCYPLRYYYGRAANWGDEHSFGLRTRFLPEQILPYFELTQTASESFGWEDDEAFSYTSTPLTTREIRRRIGRAW